MRDDLTIDVVGAQGFPDLLPLVRAYRDFYAAHPSDSALLALFKALVRDPVQEGLTCWLLQVHPAAG
jgi:hypothetical protein